MCNIVLLLGLVKKYYQVLQRYYVRYCFTARSGEEILPSIAEILCAVSVII